jgi:nucleoside-diphosphate kinase
MVVEGENAVAAMRMMSGATNPMDASVGTIRGDFGLDVGRNIIHTADSLKSAEREIAIHFTGGEMIKYTRAEETWVYE